MEKHVRRRGERRCALRPCLLCLPIEAKAPGLEFQLNERKRDSVLVELQLQHEIQHERWLSMIKQHEEHDLLAYISILATWRTSSFTLYRTWYNHIYYITTPIPRHLLFLDLRNVRARQNVFADHQVLTKVSLHCAAGKTTALVGFSGSGGRGPGRFLTAQVKATWENHGKTMGKSWLNGIWWNLPKLVMTVTGCELGNHHGKLGKIQYKWWFSIVMFNYQRV